MKGKIYWKYDYYRGGLGDFVRGALATYAFCQSRDLDFQIWIPDHPLKVCFDLAQITRPTCSTEITLDAGENREEILHKIFDHNPSEEIILITNSYTIVPQPEDWAANFKGLLQPATPIRSRIAQIYEQLKIAPRSYVSLHVRCGDAFMRAFDRYCPGDNRCDPATALKDVEAAITVIRRDTDLPILFHTDSEELRFAVRHLPLIPLESRIQHTAQHSETGDAADYYDSVAEFFIIAQAAHVYYTVPSGFTRWSTTLYGTPLTLLRPSTN